MSHQFSPMLLNIDIFQGIVSKFKVYNYSIATVFNINYYDELRDTLLHSDIYYYLNVIY